MQRKIKLIILASLLVGGVVICAIRWKAWFGMPPEPKWEGPVIDYKFITFNNDTVLRSLQCDTVSFILFGDIHNSLTNDQMASIYDRHPDVRFWAQLGDLMERPGHYYEQLLFHSLVGTGFDSLPIVATPGNHEYEKGIRKTLSNRWKTLFANPQNGPARFLGRTYYVDFPHLRLITIDTDGLFFMSDYTQVSFWLKKTLSEAGDRFKVVMMHHPIFSTACGRTNPMIWLAFHDAVLKADVVFSGHDHNYARRIDKHKEYFWKKEEPTFFVGTNSSNKVYPVKDNVNYESSFSGEPVYEYITVMPKTLHISTYCVDNNTAGNRRLIDEFSVHK